MLVRRLEIEICRELKFGTSTQNSLMAHSTVEPDIEGIIATNRSDRSPGQAAPLGIIE
jgi:hypothetical protein